MDADSAALFFDGFDDAIIGLVTQGHGDPWVVYDGEAIIGLIAADIALSDPTLSEEEVEDMARDHYDYNVLGSVPEGCPYIMEPLEDWWDPVSSFPDPTGREPDQAHFG
jgi:hypothetical protein